MVRFSSRFSNQRRRDRWLRFCGIGIAVCCSLLFGAQRPFFIGLALPASASEARASAATSVEAGLALYENNDFLGAIQKWQAVLDSESLSQADRATILENLARAYQRIGQSAESLRYWEQAADQTAALGDQQQLGRLQTEQAQLYSQTGQQRQAIALLCGSEQTTTCTPSSALKLAESSGDREGYAAALGSLGEVLRRKRDYTQAQTTIELALQAAQSADKVNYQIAALSSLGTLHFNQTVAKRRRAASLGETGEGPLTQMLNDEADSHLLQSQRAFEQSLAQSQQTDNLYGALRSHLGLIPIYRQLQQNPAAQSAQAAALKLLQQMPASVERVDATVTLANLIQFDGYLTTGTAGAQCFAGEAADQTQTLLISAVEQAQALANSRAASFATGALGHWYECQGAYPQALQLTQQAQWLADQQRQAQDSLYLWQWQAGRIYLAQAQTDNALLSYRQAVETLEGIRNDLLASNQDLQFDFRAAVEPIYRELIALRLADLQQESLVASEVNGLQLWEAIATLDSLKLAELQNYFGGDCEIVPFTEEQVGLTGVESTTATITSIVLEDRTAAIASFPNGQRWISWIPASAIALRDTVNEFRQGLERFYDLSFDPTLAQQLYDWMLRPFEAQLAAQGIETLVFVNDGILRSVPMAALHDGKQFLAQKYATATVPTLSLVASSELRPASAKALVVGTSEPSTVDGQAFPALPFVNREVLEVQREVPNSQILLDDAFTRDRLSQELSDRAYSVLHIATHAQFGANPEDAFLIAGQGEKLTFSEMDRLIRRSTASENKPIELLALTACETAIGDDRAALGVGGVAVRAGAKSAIASLWSIGDESTAQLSARFYRGLVNDKLSKAKALQQAQISLIEENQHPAVWSPLIVVGNWN